MRREWIVCFVLAVLTLGVYWPVRNYDFVYYDDPQFISENEQIKGGLSWEGVVYAFREPVVGNWHPVTVLSHMLDCELFGEKAGAHHLVNVVFHTINAVLLFLVLWKLTGSTWRSAMVAGLFALHPLRVESVAWVSERKDVLSGLFFLLTIWDYAASTRSKAESRKQKTEMGLREHGAKSKAKSGKPEDGGRSLVYYPWALVFFALGLMSKPMLVTVPFVLLLLDLWPLGRLRASDRFTSFWPLVREKIPFFVLAAICSVITLRVQRSVGAMAFFHNLTYLERVENAVVSYVRYLGKMVWPSKLAVVYPHTARGYILNEQWPIWEVGAALLLLLLISVVCILRIKRQPYLAVGWFWFLGMLVPVIGLVQVGEQAMANRYTYLPLIGPAIALVWGLRDWLGVGSRKTSVEESAPVSAGRDVPRSVPWLLAGGGIALAALAWLTHLQVGHWRNTVSLFTYAVGVTSDNPSAQFALGVGLEKEGRLKEAMVQYRVALAIDPKYSKADYNLGQLYSKSGDLKLAAVHFQAAVDSGPGNVAARLNLANVLQRLGRQKEVVMHYEEALRLDPKSTEGLNNLAWLLASDPNPELRNGKRAVELAERACALTEQKMAVMLGTLAAAYAEAGRFPEAVATAERACATAMENGEPAVAARNRELMELYRAGRAYHETEPKTANGVDSK